MTTTAKLLSMTNREILAKIDHTLLKAAATWPQIRTLCEEAIAYNTASACLPPSYVKRAREAYPTLNLCTVIGFPLGYSSAAAKCCEAEIALDEGANELDYVINIGHAKNGDFGAIQRELQDMRALSREHILKVIVETCYLTDEDKQRLCQIVGDVGANYIKTSTGFGTAGATRDDVLLFKRHLQPAVKIKAAGGIRTLEALKEFIALGCDRIGASSAVNLLKE